MENTCPDCGGTLKFIAAIVTQLPRSRFIKPRGAEGQHGLPLKGWFVSPILTLPGEFDLPGAGHPNTQFGQKISARDPLGTSPETWALKVLNTIRDPQFWAMLSEISDALRGVLGLHREYAGF